MHFPLNHKNIDKNTSSVMVFVDLAFVFAFLSFFDNVENEIDKIAASNIKCNKLRAMLAQQLKDYCCCGCCC